MIKCKIKLLLLYLQYLKIERVTVYYAEDTDGLETEPPGSVHAQLIDFCGGRNVADVQMNGQNGETDVSMEQVFS